MYGIDAQFLYITTIPNILAIVVSWGNILSSEAKHHMHTHTHTHTQIDVDSDRATLSFQNKARDYHTLYIYVF